MSVLPADRENPSDASHRWRRTRGDGIHESRRRFVVPGGGALGDGMMFLQGVGGQGGPGGEAQQDRRVVRAMARSDHWRWVSMPRWVRTSWKVTSSCQRRTNHSSIWVGSAAGSVQRRAWGSKVPWGSRTNTQRMRYGRLARALPGGGLGGEFHVASGAVVPIHRSDGPCPLILVKE